MPAKEPDAACFFSFEGAVENGDRSRRIATSPGLRAQLEALMCYVPLGEEIESFWRDPDNRSVSAWSEHRDINEVMLATHLVPDGFLVLVPPD